MSTKFLQLLQKKVSSGGCISRENASKAAMKEALCGVTVCMHSNLSDGDLCGIGGQGHGSPHHSAYGWFAIPRYWAYDMAIKRTTAALGSIGWKGLSTLYLVSVLVRLELMDSAGPPTDSPNLRRSQPCLGMFRRAGG